MKKDNKQRGLVEQKKVTTTVKERMEKDLEVEATCVEGIITEPIRVDNKYYFEGPVVVPEDEAQAIGEAVAADNADDGGGEEGSTDPQRASKEEEEHKRGGRR
jgi:hypothetical protein